MGPCGQDRWRGRRGRRHHRVIDPGAERGRGHQLSGRLGARTATTIKVFIDIFIGVWAFVLGYIWTNHINATGSKARLARYGSVSRSS